MSEPEKKRVHLGELLIEYSLITTADLEVALTEQKITGQRIGELPYVGGRTHGMMRHWYENGKLKGQVPYRKGTPEGKATDWYDNGQKWSEGQFKSGSRHGEWTYWWRETGQKWFTKNYVNGTLEGAWLNWHPNGQLWVSGTYRRGKKTGVWTHWTKTGVLAKRETFKNGELIATE